MSINKRDRKNIPTSVINKPNPLFIIINQCRFLDNLCMKEAELPTSMKTNPYPRENDRRQTMPYVRFCFSEMTPKIVPRTGKAHGIMENPVIRPRTKMENSVVSCL